ncbi:MAG: Zn-ribbon domain-containing OB-fold protein [Deltaproteobacteria bacterium]|nr:Zn-ribbon domain-containing OB-fold protein [Deltaproteobacteria bacterium]
MKKIKTTVDETTGGTILYNVPFPKNIESLKEMSPIIIKQPYSIDYIHSYGQDSPWFAGLSNKKLLGTKCTACGYVFATPKLSCMECGKECDWIELPQEGKIHSFTVCHFGAEAFLDQCPFILGLIEFEGANTLLLTRLIGFDPQEANLKWVGQKVKAKFRRKSEFKPTDVYFIPA